MIENNQGFFKSETKPANAFSILFDVIKNKRELTSDDMINIFKIKQFLSHSETEMDKLGWMHSKYFSKLSHSDFKKKIYVILERLEPAETQKFVNYINSNQFQFFSQEDQSDSDFLALYNRIRSIFHKRMPIQTKTKRISKDLNKNQKKKATSFSRIIPYKNFTQNQQGQQQSQSIQQQPEISNKETLQNYPKKVNKNNNTTIEKQLQYQ